MSAVDFQIAYDGVALRDHAIDVDALGPALLALGELCREANRTLNGEKASVSVRVRANAERKCFDVHLQLVQTLLESVKTFLDDDYVSTAKNLLEWIGLLGGPPVTLLGFLKWRKGRPIKNATRIEARDGTVSYNITIEGDGATVNIPAPVFDLAKEPRVLRAQRGIIRPLRTEGIDRLEVRDGEKVIESILKEEVKYFDFDIDESPEMSKPQTFETILSLRAPVFVAGARWQFLMGENRIVAIIADIDFNHRVFSEGERFGVGDKFKVLLKMEQYQTPTGQIRNRYEVVEVLHFWRSSEQPPLPLELSPDLSPDEDEGTR